MKLDQLNSKTHCTPSDVCSTSGFMHVAGCVCDDDGQVAHLPRILHQSSLPFSALGWQGSVSSRVCDYSEEEEGRGRRRRQVKSVHFGVAISANAVRRDNWSFQEPFFLRRSKKRGWTQNERACVEDKRRGVSAGQLHVFCWERVHSLGKWGFKKKQTKKKTFFMYFQKQTLPPYVVDLSQNTLRQRGCQHIAAPHVHVPPLPKNTHTHTCTRNVSAFHPFD